MNGILALARDHIGMAEMAGKQVYVGVETQELRFREYQFILGRSERNFRAAFSGSCRDIPSVLSGGERIVAIEVFGMIHVGVPRTASPHALLRLADCFGHAFDLVDTVFVQQRFDQLRFWSRHLGEWENPQRGAVIERGGKRFQTILMCEKELPHVSFSEESLAYLQAEVSKVDSSFGVRPSYRGVAVHDFQGALRLLLKN